MGWIRLVRKSCAGWILELDRGKGIPFEGNYSSWLEAKNKRLSAESKGQVHTVLQILQRTWHSPVAEHCRCSTTRGSHLRRQLTKVTPK